MKSKQLANFLIKALGIYFIYQNSTIFLAQVSSSVNMYIKYPANENAFIMFSGLGLGSLVVIIASMLLIFKSKSIASFLFRNEED